MPSPADVRRRALLAAAKVTLSLSALACADTESSSSTASLTPGATGGQSAAGASLAAGHAGQTSAGQGGAGAGAPGAVAAAGVSGSSGDGGASGAGQAGAAPSGLACGLPADAPFTSETVACCHERLDAVLPIDPAQPWIHPDWPEALGAPELACCEAVVAHREATLADPAQPFDELAQAQASRCCQYLDKTGPTFQGPTCSPWGPPMPPAMPAWMVLDERVVA